MVAAAHGVVSTLLSGVVGAGTLSEVQRPAMLLADFAHRRGALQSSIRSAALTLALGAGPEHPAQGQAQPQPQEQFQHRTPQQAQRHGAGGLSRQAPPVKRALPHDYLRV